jgi:ubiquinone/menaquinone biosynthesis C-methylase UbiE
MPSHLDTLNRVYGPETWDIYDVLDRSLEPRGREWLHELAADYLTVGARILDAGCRDASDLIRLVQAHDGFGVGVDPVAIHVERARAAVAAASLEERIEIVDGVMETLPYADCSFDFVWCRDVLEGVEPLDDALRALARMLKRDGRMLVYTSFATDLLTREEHRLLERQLSNLTANLDEEQVEAAFVRAGLQVERKDIVWSEFKEYAEERTQPGSRTLLRLARLRRSRERLERELPVELLNHVEATLHWELFLFLGKLQPTVYVLTHS